MTEAEKLAQKLMSGDTETAKVDADDASRGRKKAARDWVQHYMSVAKFIKELDTKPTSVEELEKALIDSWEAKADAKQDEFNALMGGM